MNGFQPGEHELLVCRGVRCVFGERVGYERLLLDAMLGDATLFAHRDGVEATWALMTPVLEDWAKNPIKDLPNYAAGSRGVRRHRMRC